jgi:hypothetical protein
MTKKSYESPNDPYRRVRLSCGHECYVSYLHRTVGRKVRCPYGVKHSMRRMITGKRVVAEIVGWS